MQEIKTTTLITFCIIMGILNLVIINLFRSLYRSSTAYITYGPCYDSNISIFIAGIVVSATMLYRHENIFKYIDSMYSTVMN